MFENHRKSRIQYCEQSELRLHFEWTKVYQKCQKWSILAIFEIAEAYSVTRQVNFNWTKITENAKIKKFKCDILGDFQTLCPFTIVSKCQRKRCHENEN